MFRDYYKILGVSPYAKPEELKAAYRAMSMKWHPDKNPGKDVTSIMQDINEAYAILKDAVKRERYDAEYRKYNDYCQQNRYASPTVKSSSGQWEEEYTIHDDEVENDIKQAKEYARTIVDEFLKSLKQTSKNAAKGAWGEAKYYVYVAIFMLVLGGVVKTCADYQHPNDEWHTKYDYNASSVPQVQADVPKHTAIRKLTEYSAPESWSKYSVNNDAFSLSVPEFVELRKEYDPYTKKLKGLGFACATDILVFQQQKLSQDDKNAYNHYCRIMVQHSKCNPGEVLSSDETESLEDSYDFFLEMVNAELSSQFNLVGNIRYEWVSIGETNAIEVKYERTSSQRNVAVSCRIYLLFNYDEMVKMIVLCRNSESEKWKQDLENVIRTFKWKS